MSERELAVNGLADYDTDALLSQIEYLYGTRGKETWLKYSKLSIPQAKRTNWRTPQWLVDAVNAEFDLQLDVCADVNNTALGAWLDEDMLHSTFGKRNALTVHSWRKPEVFSLKAGWRNLPEFKRIWCNPPFDNIPSFLVKMQNELAKPQFENIELAVCLLPYRAGSKWFRDLVIKPLFGKDEVISLTQGDYYYGFASTKGGPFYEDDVMRGHTGELRVLKSRLVFDEQTSKSAAPFDCCLAIFRGKWQSMYAKTAGITGGK